jgi:hypothetical protein
VLNIRYFFRHFKQSTRSLVAVQIASDLFEREKARSIKVYMSTFDAGIRQIRGEPNSYSTGALKMVKKCMIFSALGDRSRFN